MSEPVIEIHNLSKAYQVYSKPTDIIKEFFSGRPYHDLFWALREISLVVKEKQRVGIIGPNGAGKSTLLKLITGNIAPTSGSINIHGKISAMLSLATSLNLEEDGLRNIKFNLLVNGCSLRDIPRLTEEIIDFTELGPFIYSPVKTYSSGMNARLAFAITTAMQPEILVVDEILSVGDGYFVGKAINRMIRLCDCGKALVFVSHSIADIRKLCETVVWLENGSIRKIGRTDDVCREYEEDYTKKRDQSERAGNRQKQLSAKSKANISSFDNNAVSRLRIVPAESEKEFSDVHYIRDLQLSIEDTDAIVVPLEMSAISQETPACLDIVDSEWGRLYNRHGHDVRVLFANTGKSRGGCLHFMVDPLLLQRQEINVSFSFRVNSHAGKEQLVIEYLDYRAAEWRKCPDLSVVQSEDGWHCVKAACLMPLVNDEEFQRAREIIHKQALPDVQIIGVTVTSQGEQVSVLQERQPFHIIVAILAHRRVSCVDVTINLYKSDGSYVFFQSSGMNPENMYDTSLNIHDLEGNAEVTFLFEQNLLNAGQYEVHAYCGNGFDMTNNLPQSEQFDVKIGATSFAIIKEFSEECMDFGQINMRVPVRIIRNSQSVL